MKKWHSEIFRCLEHQPNYELFTDYCSFYQEQPAEIVLMESLEGDFIIVGLPTGWFVSFKKVKSPITGNINLSLFKAEKIF